MTKAEIMRTQCRVGAKPDAFWGPKSIAAAQKHLRALLPSPNPWPTTSQAALIKFYGNPGDERQMTTIEPPYAMRLYDTRQPVKRITVNKACAASLVRVLEGLARVYPTDAQREAAGVTKYFGCFVDRNMRGGSLPSLHAYGAAIDFDANRNGNRTHWPLAAVMPIEVMECFAKEGWLSAGVFWSRDSMHSQATR